MIMTKSELKVVKVEQGKDNAEVLSVQILNKKWGTIENCGGIQCLPSPRQIAGQMGIKKC